MFSFYLFKLQTASRKMQIIKQEHSIPVLNLDDIVINTYKIQKHGPLLPSSIRCIICGASGCGKTNVVISLIVHPNALRFENIYIYSKSLNQPKYEFLKEIFQSIKEIGYYDFSENDDVIDLDKAHPNSIFIFDDIASSKQDKIQNYFSRGRHNSIDSFYLSQTYAKIPKHLIRDNINMCVLFKQDDLNLRHVYDEHVTTDMSFQTFKDICSKCWDNKYGFIVIIKDNEIKDGRYRKGFDSYIYI